MKKWRMIPGVVAIVALLTVTGIASGQSNAPARQQLTEFKLGVFPAADYTPLFVGLKRGIFKKHGLDTVKDKRRIITAIGNACASASAAPARCA